MLSEEGKNIATVFNTLFKLHVFQLDLHDAKMYKNTVNMAVFQPGQEATLNTNTGKTTVLVFLFVSL